MNDHNQLPFIDYFQLLEVHYLADEDAVKSSYRRLCKRHHPDNCATEDSMHAINDAYEILIHPQQREAYILQWCSYYGDRSILHGNRMTKSPYDFSVQPLRLVIMEYLYHLKAKDYAQAYSMLSANNKKKIFKRDFLTWQRLVAEIHELMAFDCTLAGFSMNVEGIEDYLTGKQIVKFKVKVIAHNRLLDKVEEDFFHRLLVYERHQWCVHLQQEKIREVIKKYKRLVSAYKKNKRINQVRRSRYIHSYAGGFVKKESFLNNCEHEQLRYLRYGNAFSMVRLVPETSASSDEIRLVLEENLRNLDSICYLNRGMFLMLLPETTADGGNQTLRKIQESLLAKAIELKEVACVEQSYASVKELMYDLMTDASMTEHKMHER